jgi:hypothetical protein
MTALQEELNRKRIPSNNKSPVQENIADEYLKSNYKKKHGQNQALITTTLTAISFN